MAERWYKRADQLFREVVVEIKKICRKMRLTMPFDSINAAKLTTVTTRMYTTLVRLNRRKYCDLCDYLWELAYLEALEALQASETASEPGGAVKRTGRGGNRVPHFSSEKFVDRFMRKPHPVTGYAYENEAERKRARLFESAIAHVEAKNRHEYEKDIQRAENLWVRQTEQGFIDIEDEVRKEAYKEAGVKEVRWNAEHDERTCEECMALDGKIFPIEHVPSKPHPRCRCWITPVK